VRVGEVAKELDLLLRVWSGDKGALTDRFAPLAAWGDTLALLDVPSRGRWLLEPRDRGDDGRSPAP
jgi:hypothetical protein